MKTFKKTLVAIAAAAMLGATALASTQASAWCDNSGYSSYGYSPSYSYSYDNDSYDYDSYHYNRGDRGEFRGHDRRDFRRH